ncbi:MarR family winged helix-turn-helix transcriptional regulator [Alkalicoccus urumqiensis]|uniref:MarR family transcriptional regulator n=1 Tax=Alkalicoccus urumqiensis TaxID=1548213 RepID=A0A2P6MLW2_ALKUR|nr:MarR family transcriptional regulator [Alkalicoccus urumqiensis]PRO67220.1 MarR family transcriptional regulator [Alkalicoccus urumqiensis]
MSGTKNERLVEELLSVLPLFSKKIFGSMRVIEHDSLHAMHLHILHVIADAGELPTTEAAAKLGLRKSNFTPLIQKLEQEGMIVRRRDEKDQRIMLAALLPEGEKLLEAQKKRMEGVVEERLDRLPEEEKEKLHRAVHDLHHVLSRLDEA